MHGKIKHIATLFLALGIAAGALWLATILAENDLVTGIVGVFGYTGLFVVAIASGFNVVVPIPLLAFMPTFLASGLSFTLVIIVATLGMTLGDTLGFFIGRAGRAYTLEDFEGNKFSQMVQFFAQKHPRGAYIVLLLFGMFAPAPNELVVVPMAFLGYQFKYMIPIVLVGNLVFNILFALGVLHIATFL